MDRLLPFLRRHLVALTIVLVVVLLIPLFVYVVSLRNQLDDTTSVVETNTKIIAEQQELIDQQKAALCEGRREDREAARAILFGLAGELPPEGVVLTSSAFVRLVNQKLPPWQCPTNEAAPTGPDSTTP